MRTHYLKVAPLTAALLFALIFPLSAFAYAAPPFPVSKESIRVQNKIDDCEKRKVGENCTDMQGIKNHCQWFMWWWIPGSNKRAFENGKDEFASHVTKCNEYPKELADKTGKIQTVTAFKCLICQ